MLRVHCSSLKGEPGRGLVEAIGQLGCNVVETPRSVQVTYEGEDQALVERLIALFSAEADHEIRVRFLAS